MQSDSEHSTPPLAPLVSQSAAYDARRNVSLYDSTAHVISGFWQYGLTTWDLFYSILRTIISTNGQDWAIFTLEPSAPSDNQTIGARQYEADGLVEPGNYILLGPDKSPVLVLMTMETTRTRHPTLSNTAPSEWHYRERTRRRDEKCLITGLPSRGNYTRLKAAHIFPRAYDPEWLRKQCHLKITDKAPPHALGGYSKIDSIQNTILLRSDVHDAWDNYEIAVNPDRDFVVYPFIPGFDDIAGRTLALDHIRDPDERPLDDLFRDHFLQGVLKHVKGAGQAPDGDWDFEEALGAGTLDLSREELWGGDIGRAHLEFELGHRLHDVQVQQAIEARES